MGAVPKPETLPRTLKNYERRIKDLERLIGLTSVASLGFEATSDTSRGTTLPPPWTHITTIQVPEWARSATVQAIAVIGIGDGGSLTATINIDGEDGFATASGTASGVHSFTNISGRTWNVTPGFSFNVSVSVTGTAIQAVPTLNVLTIFNKEAV